MVINVIALLQFLEVIFVDRRSAFNVTFMSHISKRRFYKFRITLVKL